MPSPRSRDLLFDNLVRIDDKGMPMAPTIRQLIDKDVRELYVRDSSEKKDRYIKECIVIYYLGDPRSPANQAGLSQSEALSLAIEQAGLPKDWFPDALVLKLIKRYHSQAITEAGRTVLNLMQAIHNSDILLTKINGVLSAQTHKELSIEEIPNTMQLIDVVKKQAGDIPNTLQKLKEAFENYLNERETEKGRGGVVVTQSMDAEMADEY